MRIAIDGSGWGAYIYYAHRVQRVKIFPAEPNALSIGADVTGTDRYFLLSNGYNALLFSNMLASDPLLITSLL